MTDSREYNIWCGIKARCYNQNHFEYKSYGGRGITLYKAWKDDFKSFYDYISSLDHYGESDYTLDRINNDGNYEPCNIRWATKIEQMNNTSYNIPITFNGKTQTIREWSIELGIDYHMLSARFYRGWDAEKALTTPVLQQYSHTRK